MRSLTKASASGFAWLLAQSGGARIVGFLSQLILARLLRPSDFGDIALASSVATVISALMGFGIDDVVVALLKREFPDMFVVQIGSKTSTPIERVDLDLIGKTTLPQASAVIEGALAHLDNESGMVHIASCFSVPSCVIFGPTPPDYFGYAWNVNVRPKVWGSCWWITEDWMDRCPRGFDEPVCTYTQPAKEVAQAMGQTLVKRGVYMQLPTCWHE
jgi:hypothetical protein